jgi:hypothetical protein
VKAPYGFVMEVTLLYVFILCQGGVKTAVGSELSLVSGTYHENKVSVVMEMASFSLKIRHVLAVNSIYLPIKGK